MSSFDKIIGYNDIKGELLGIADMMKNPALYEELGAKMPRGALIYGKPGLGKTMLAKAFIEECGLPAFTVQKSDDKILAQISEAFKAAAEQTPAIVFLDDMDKLANEDEKHKDAKEYVAIQSEIEGVKDKKVFVLATANDVKKLPDSLKRSGRFDREFEVESPNDEDGRKIIEYYLSTKKVSDNVNLEDLCMMTKYSSCAELETILNEAALYAGRMRHSAIEMSDLVRTVLRIQYDCYDLNPNYTDEERRKIALHEAGHLVVAEALIPGSVGLASLRSSDDDCLGGFIHCCKDLKRRPHEILVTLGGKAATELYYSEACASGCYSDLRKVVALVRDGFTDSGTHGVAYLDTASCGWQASDLYRFSTESAVHADIERFMFKAKDILLKNREFLDKITEALFEKGTLLYSDIRAIRESVALVPAVV